MGFCLLNNVAVAAAAATVCEDSVLLKLQRQASRLLVEPLDADVWEADGPLAGCVAVIGRGDASRLPAKGSPTAMGAAALAPKGSAATAAGVSDGRFWRASSNSLSIAFSVAFAQPM